jgi:Na+/H+ antiporter NhaC
MKWRWTEVVFCTIWLVTAIVFGILACGAYNDTHTTLVRYSANLPTGTAILIGNINTSEVMNSLSSTNNENVAALEESIRGSAKTGLWLNIISMFMALSGLAAQIAANDRENRYNGHEQ